MPLSRQASFYLKFIPVHPSNFKTTSPFMCKLDPTLSTHFHWSFSPKDKEVFSVSFILSPLWSWLQTAELASHNVHLISVTNRSETKAWSHKKIQQTTAAQDVKTCRSFISCLFFVSPTCRRCLIRGSSSPAGAKSGKSAAVESGGGGGTEPTTPQAASFVNPRGPVDGNQKSGF